jgi:hypothetical protein
MSEPSAPIYYRIKFSEASGHRLFSYGKPMETRVAFHGILLKMALFERHLSPGLSFD